MTSGVYQLTFPSGATYIGKSIHIENRWRQHIDKMRRGKAAKLMQLEWNRYRDFSAQVLIECHEDHIDVVEACFINRNKPTLNGTYPNDPYPNKSVKELYELFETFKQSAEQHVEAINKTKQELINNKNQVKKLDATIDELEELNDLLLKKRFQEELIADVSGTIKSQNTCIVEQQQYINNLNLELENLNKECNKECNKQFKELEYHRRPWWEKIFR